MIREERVRLEPAGFSTRVLRSGAGAPVLLLHGSPDSAGEWRPAMEALGDGVACYAPDLPGLGACEEPPPSFDFSRAANDAFLEDLLAALGIAEPVVLAVHDIGGVYGIPWAARHRERIRGLLITNTVVFEKFGWFFPATWWASTSALGRLAASGLMAQIGWFGGAIFRAQFARISPELSAEHLDRMTREFACDPKSKRSTLRLFRQMVPHAYFDGFEAMVRELLAQVPVRVIWGRGDPYIPARYADSFPGAPREISARGGHWIPISEARAVAAAIRALLG
jgi:haloalkane dehalogenase